MVYSKSRLAINLPPLPPPASRGSQIPKSFGISYGIYYIGWYRKHLYIIIKILHFSNNEVDLNNNENDSEDKIKDLNDQLLRELAENENLRKVRYKLLSPV